MKPVVPLPGFNTRYLCRVCRGPAEVSWPVRNSPHCRRCVAEARAFLAESAPRHPKFGGDETREQIGSLRSEGVDAVRAWRP
jgi:hypothetical protein